MPPRRFAPLLPVYLLAAVALAGCGTARPNAAGGPAATAPADTIPGRPRGHGRGPDPGRIGPFAPAPPVVPGADEAEAAVRGVLDAQVAAWNAGDIRGFMTGYARNDTLLFVSNGQVRRGWQNAYYGYMRSYPDQASMGTLSFEGLDVDVIAPEVALVQGVFRLRYAPEAGAEPQPDAMGVFTLVFRHTADTGWKIVMDHTSSSP